MIICMIGSPAARTNDDWLTALRAGGPAREAALADLRTIIVRGLQFGLTGWMDIAAPEFEPLAQDFAQDTLLKVLANLDTFRGQSQFTTWAHKIAVNVALTELRRRRWKDVSLEGMMESAAGDASPRISADLAPGPEAQAEQTDMMTHLQKIMKEELTDRQLRAMMAVAVKGVPLEEVARRMGMERNALYKLLHDARVRLKRRMAREGLAPTDMLTGPGNR